MRGRPGCLLQSAGGEADRILSNTEIMYYDMLFLFEISDRGARECMYSGLYCCELCVQKMPYMYCAAFAVCV